MLRPIVSLSFALAIACAPPALAQEAGAASGDTVFRSGSGAARDSIVPGTAERAATRSFTELLTGRVPGLFVRQASGSVGAGARVQLRSPSSLLLPAHPLVVVDGLPVISDPYGLTIDVGGQEVSRIDDLDPEHVVSVEVLHGPAAAARYGPAAANGVILVTTDRAGEREPARFHAFAEAGVRADAARYPANYERRGRFGGGETGGCTLLAEAGGACTPFADSLLSFNPLEAHSPYRTSSRYAAGASVRGGAGRVGYAAALGGERDLGLLPENHEDRLSLAGAVTARPFDALRLDLSAAHLRRDLSLPFEGNSSIGRIRAGLYGAARDDENGGYRPGAPGAPAGYDNAHETGRTRAALRADWAALPWLSVGGRFGVDRADTDERPVVDDGGPAVRTVAAERSLRVADAHATLGGGLGGWHLSATLGAERQWDDAEAVDSTYSGDQVFNVARWEWKRELTGLYLETAARGGRAEVAGALRRDAGDAGPELWAGSLAGRWDAGPTLSAGGLDALWLRAAYGRAARYAGMSPGLDRADAPPEFFACPFEGCTSGDRPEVTEEVEAGLDALLSGGLGVRLTAYRRETEDLLQVVGFPAALGNLGRLRAWGAEGSVRAGGDLSDGVTGEVELLGALARNRVSEQNGAGSLLQTYGEDIPVGAYTARPIVSWRDADGDGVIVPSEVTLGDTLASLGSPLPTRMLAVAGRLEARGATLSARLEHQGGARMFNVARLQRCTAFQSCREANDPRAPLADQAAVAATRPSGPLGSPVSQAGFVEDASFVRLREVALTLAAPERVARAFGARGAELTLAGRNLLTWTPYSGLDPETNGSGVGVAAADFATQPVPRSFTTRIDVRF
ncbi:MAG TPA: TonB-dependent receptor plug domain-containing protein [Longimicrobium sp.]|nr:TonB-dependent receptor plug domain-containing protein [Longimicrobium sp.]